MSPDWEWGSFSHAGGREENQDASCVLSDEDSGEVLAAVADGMGGHDEGGLAARTAIDTVRACWEQRRGRPLETFLGDLFIEAHEAIREAAAAKSLDTRTVLAVLILCSEAAFVAHAGDCRVVQYRNGARLRRTLDHSLAELSVLRGRITESEMATAKGQSRLTTCLGGEELPDTEVERWEFRAGDEFVVCSDGFWELFPDEDQLHLLSSQNLEEAVERTVSDRLSSPDLATHDNTTSVLLRRRSKNPRMMALSRSSHFPPRKILAIGLALAIAMGLIMWGLAGRWSDDSPSTRGESDSAAGQESSEAKDLSSEKRVDTEWAVNSESQDLESDQPRSEGGAAQTTEPESRESGFGAKMRLELDLPVHSESEAVSAAEDLLFREGRLAGSSTLSNLPAMEAEKIVPLEGDGGTTTTLRLVQKYGDLPIYTAEVRLTLRDGKLVGLDGTTYAEVDLSKGKLLEFEEALSKASSGSVSGTIGPPPAKWLFPEQTGKTFEVVWRADVIGSATKLPETWFIDARSGDLVRIIPLVPKGATK